MDVGANNTPVEVIREGAPVEVIREGAFGGTYFRDIYSGINEKSQPENIGLQDVPRTSPSNVPRTSHKDPI